MIIQHMIQIWQSSHEVMSDTQGHQKVRGNKCLTCFITDVKKHFKLFVEPVCRCVDLPPLIDSNAFIITVLHF